MTKYKPGSKLIANGKINLPVVGSVKIVTHRPIARYFRPLKVHESTSPTHDGLPGENGYTTLPTQSTWYNTLDLLRRSCGRSICPLHLALWREG